MIGIPETEQETVVRLRKELTLIRNSKPGPRTFRKQIDGIIARERLGKTPQPVIDQLLKLRR